MTRATHPTSAAREVQMTAAWSQSVGCATCQTQKSRSAANHNLAHLPQPFHCQRCTSSCGTWARPRFSNRLSLKRHKYPLLLLRKTREDVYKKQRLPRPRYLSVGFPLPMKLRPTRSISRIPCTTTVDMALGSRTGIASAASSNRRKRVRGDARLYWSGSSKQTMRALHTG